MIDTAGRRVNFNPRSLTGATSVNDKPAVRSDISIHAPSRERPKIFKPRDGVITFQSTLPHGSDDMTFEEWVKIYISIHAPSRERPILLIIIREREGQFQSTLPHGSDLMVCRSCRRSLTFQSTLPHGSDPIMERVRDWRGDISIHAPSRERPPCIISAASLPSFQSTLPHGSD